MHWIKIALLSSFIAILSYRSKSSPTYTMSKLHLMLDTIVDPKKVPENTNVRFNEPVIKNDSDKSIIDKATAVNTDLHNFLLEQGIVFIH